MRRITRQREAVCRAFTESEIPLGPHEALHAAQHYVPGLGIATVYRTIRTDCWPKAGSFPLNCRADPLSISALKRRINTIFSVGNV